MDAQTKALIRDSIRGVAETTDTERGLAINRLPDWTKIHHQNDSLTAQVAAKGSGVRILIQTAATEITFTYRATLDVAEWMGGSAISTVGLSSEGFETSVSHSNGNRRIWNGPFNPTLVEGEDSKATFTMPPGQEARAISIWLPHNCEIEILNLTANEELSPGLPAGSRWVHYGSSISHAGEADTPLGVWPTRVAIDAGLDLYNLGLAGSCNLENFAARTIAALPADLITLKLGINVANGASMTERTFIPAVHALLDTIRQRQPKTRVVVISPIYCAGQESLPGPVLFDQNGKAVGSQPRGVEWVKELTLIRIRRILADAVANREDENLEYIDGLQLFSAADAHLMPDGLHPNAEGYLLIAERFKQLILS